VWKVVSKADWKAAWREMRSVAMKVAKTAALTDACSVDEKAAKWVVY